MVLPNFIIIGAQKSGTTSLKFYLNQHPDIYMPKSRINFFDKPKNYSKGIKWYEKNFDCCNSENCIGEKTTEYLHPFSKIVSERIFNTLPNVKLIALLRNPVERAYSHYWHNRINGLEPLSFEKALKLEEERIKLDYEIYNRKMALYSYKYRGKYIEHIKRFAHFFKKEKMLFLLTDNLKNHREETLIKVFRFLGVKENIHINDLSERLIGGYPRSYSLAELQNNKLVEKFTFKLKSREINPIRNFIKKINYKKEKPLMKESTRNYLYEYFRHYNEDLADFLRIDLGNWKNTKTL